MNYYSPAVLTDEMKQRPNRYADAIIAAYTAAGLEPPTFGTPPIAKLLEGHETRRHVIDDITIRYLNDLPVTTDDLAEYERRYNAAAFHEAARMAMGTHEKQHLVSVGDAAVQRAYGDLAPAVEALGRTLADAARKLDPARPLDPVRAVETGTSDALQAAQQTLTALAAIATIHGRVGSKTLGNAPVLALLPVLDLPPVGYVEPQTVEDVAKGVGVEPLPGQVAVEALKAAAAESADLALIRAARGDFEGVSFSLADPRALSKRLARVENAAKAYPFSYEQALAHKQGAWASSGQSVEQWAAVVIAAREHTKPEHVARARHVVGQGRPPQVGTRR